MSLQLSVPRPGTGKEPGFDLTLEGIPAWLASLPKDDALAAATQLLTMLKRLNRTRVRVTLRQETAELFLVHANSLLPALDAQLAAATVPLSTQTRSGAAVADELLAELANSHKLLLVEQGRRLFGLASSGRAQLPVVRAMQLIARRLALAYRMYATNPKGAWQELHELHHFALRRGLATRSLPGEAETPSAIYRNALLFAFAEPLKLMQGDIERVRLYVERFGDLARLAPYTQSKPNQGLFLIKPQRDVPGYALAKRHPVTPHPNDLMLETLPLAEKLLGQLARLAAGETLAQIGLPDLGNEAAFRDLMARLVKHWGSVPSRRFTRLRTHARVEISVGLRGIWDYLEHPDQHAQPRGEWLVTNESPRGFALLHLAGPVEPFGVGEAVGLRTRESEGCHVCMVRWVRSDNPDHVELGLEEIAPSARAVSLRKARGADREERPALLLPEVPALNQAPAILAPLVALDTTCELNLGDLQSRLRVKATRLLERTVSVQLVQFSAVA